MFSVRLSHKIITKLISPKVRQKLSNTTEVVMKILSDLENGHFWTKRET